MDFATYQQQRFMQLMSSVGVASLDLLGGMGASLGLLNVQMAELRALNATQLALQQLILQRDEIQQHLEELVYQGQKMVEAFADRADKTPAVQKALLLRSFYMCVTKAGIGTAAIRGLQNKRVFDALMSEVKSQYRQLGHDPAVRKAVANEEAAEKRQLAAQAEEQQRRLEEERRLKRLELQRRNAMLPSISRASGGMLDIETATKELWMSMPFADSFHAIRTAFKTVGKLGSVEEDNGRISGSIGSGFFNMNAADVTVEVLEAEDSMSQVVIRASAQEGLIPQNTAAKAVSRLLKAIEE